MLKSKCPACNTTFWNPVIVEKTVKWYKFQQIELYCPSCKVQLKEKRLFLYFAILLLLIFLFIGAFLGGIYRIYFAYISLPIHLYAILFRKYEVYEKDIEK